MNQHVGTTASGASRGSAQPRRPVAVDRSSEVWVRDLEIYTSQVQAQFRWDRHDVMGLVGEAMQGRTSALTPLEVSTVADLRRLDRAKARAHQDVALYCAVIAPDYEAAVEGVGIQAVRELTYLTLEEELYIPAYWEAWSSLPGWPFEDDLVQQARRTTRHDNPLITMWELLQVARMFAAAEAVLNDALCDLVDELSVSRSLPALAAALGPRYDALALSWTLDRHHEERGWPGDARREIVQKLPPLQDEWIKEVLLGRPRRRRR